ncbi:hypothetical protein D3C83_08610 [compost metagenome]
MHLLDEMLEHLLGDGEIGDHAVFHRTDGRDVAGCAAQHLLRGEAHLLDHLLAIGTAFLADRHHRRLIQHDALAPHVDQGVGGAQVDREIVVEVAA